MEYKVVVWGDDTEPTEVTRQITIPASISDIFDDGTDKEKYRISRELVMILNRILHREFIANRKSKCENNAGGPGRSI